LQRAPRAGVRARACRTAPRRAALRRSARPRRAAAARRHDGLRVVGAVRADVVPGARPRARGATAPAPPRLPARQRRPTRSCPRPRPHYHHHQFLSTLGLLQFSVVYNGLSNFVQQLDRTPALDALGPGGEAGHSRAKAGRGRKSSQVARRSSWTARPWLAVSRPFALPPYPNPTPPHPPSPPPVLKSYTRFLESCFGPAYKFSPSATQVTLVALMLAFILEGGRR
jgi:hypothetical protein